MKPIFITFFVFTVMSVFSGQALSQDFVYRPKNPAFGGNYLNYQWMLSSANAQNTLEDKKDDLDLSSYGEYDPMSDFKKDLQRRFFDELSRQIINSYFGEGSYQGEDIDDGTYNFGNYEIDIYSNSQGLNISIRDYLEGGETVITIPNY
jgi:curli production assembly/transport component CsgF